VVTLPGGAMEIFHRAGSAVANTEKIPSLAVLAWRLASVPCVTWQSDSLGYARADDRLPRFRPLRVEGYS